MLFENDRIQRVREARRARGGSLPMPPVLTHSMLTGLSHGAQTENCQGGPPQQGRLLGINRLLLQSGVGRIVLPEQRTCFSRTRRFFAPTGDCGPPRHAACNITAGGRRQRTPRACRALLGPARHLLFVPLTPLQSYFQGLARDHVAPRLAGALVSTPAVQTAADHCRAANAGRPPGVYELPLGGLAPHTARDACCWQPLRGGRSTLAVASEVVTV